VDLGAHQEVESVQVSEAVWSSLTTRSVQAVELGLWFLEAVQSQVHLMDQEAEQLDKQRCL
jgi:hypothetical protein